jgi:hypothetical protein
MTVIIMAAGLGNGATAYRVAGQQLGCGGHSMVPRIVRQQLHLRLLGYEEDLTEASRNSGVAKAAIYHHNRVTCTTNNTPHLNGGGASCSEGGVSNSEDAPACTTLRRAPAAAREGRQQLYFYSGIKILTLVV